MLNPAKLLLIALIISIHSENLIHLALMVQKFKFLEDPIKENPPNLAPPIAVAQKFSDIFNRSNFEYSASSGLKVHNGRRKRKKKKKKKRCQNKKNSIQIG